MENIVAFFQKHATGKLVVVLFVLTMTVYFTMLLYAIPSVIKLAPEMKLFDMSPTGYSSEYAFTLLESIGPDGRNTYLTVQLPLDFIYPGLSAVTYSLLLIWLFGKGFQSGSKIFYFAFVPIVAGVFDYLENVGIIAMINAFPNISDGLVEISSTFTLLKSGFTVVFFALLAVGVFPLVKRKIGMVLSKN